MPNLYYKQEYDMGNGKKFGMLYVDSCLMLCSNFSYAGGTIGLHSNMFDPVLMMLRDAACTDESMKWGNIQYSWI